MWGKEVIGKDLIWRVGNGENIQMQHDPWIPRPSSLKPIHINSPMPTYVKDLMLVPSSWNESLLNTFFLPLEHELISSIPLSIQSRVDEVIWHYEKKDLYTVCGGYNLLMHGKLREVGSISSLLPSRWKGLWKLNIPSKVRAHLFMVIVAICPFQIGMGKMS